MQEKEFANDAINNNLDLKAPMDEWAKLTKIQVRNRQEITQSNVFNICSFHWVLSPHNKTGMLQRYHKFEWNNTVNANLLRAFWDPEIRRNPAARQKVQEYELEVARDAILEQSLQKIVKI